VNAEIWSGPLGALLLGYLLGSIPFGILVTRFAGAGDLRAIGSGNIGATNVLRTGRKGLAAATLLLDAGKGAAAVLLVGALAPDLAIVAAIGAFLGHLYPVWLRFRGGKGVATLLGLGLALSWPAGLIGIATWLAGMAVTRISSVGGMAAAIALPVATALAGSFDLTLLFIALGLLVLWKHRGNIARLIAGTEPRIGGGGQTEGG
jgi:acyl phosphate:glycerol-3-phosphate acyltransferase